MRAQQGQVLIGLVHSGMAARMAATAASAALSGQPRLVLDGRFALRLVAAPVAGHAGWAAVEHLVAAAALAEAAAPHSAACGRREGREGRMG